MYDLSYRGEHMAWQQRLEKEQKVYGRPFTQTGRLLRMASNPNCIVNEPYTASDFVPPLLSEAPSRPSLRPSVRVRKKYTGFYTPTNAAGTRRAVFPSYPLAAGSKEDFAARKRESRRERWLREVQSAQSKVQQELVRRLAAAVYAERKVSGMQKREESEAHLLTLLQA